MSWRCLFERAAFTKNVSSMSLWKSVTVKPGGLFHTSVQLPGVFEYASSAIFGMSSTNTAGTPTMSRFRQISEIL